MGGRGAAGPRTTTTNENKDTRQYKSGTNNIDYSGTMRNAYFKSVGDLLSTIHRAESKRFDILDRRGDSYSGSFMYTDKYASDGIAYEVRYQRSYANPANPSEIQIIDFREYEEGEW